eukprot:2769854-Pyramimonas_sp.AAC.1
MAGGHRGVGAYALVKRTFCRAHPTRRGAKGGNPGQSKQWGVKWFVSRRHSRSEVDGTSHRRRLTYPYGG